jgi:hypothetical protein
VGCEWWVVASIGGSACSWHVGRGRMGARSREERVEQLMVVVVATSELLGSSRATYVIVGKCVVGAWLEGREETTRDERSRAYRSVVELENADEGECGM